jgi:hypothetical protein
LRPGIDKTSAIIGSFVFELGAFLGGRPLQQECSEHFRGLRGLAAPFAIISCNVAN